VQISLFHTKRSTYMSWIRLAQGRLLWIWYWTFRFHKMQGIHWPAEGLLCPEEGLYFVELVITTVLLKWVPLKTLVNLLWSPTTYLIATWFTTHYECIYPDSRQASCKNETFFLMPPLRIHLPVLINFIVFFRKLELKPAIFPGGTDSRYVRGVSSESDILCIWDRMYI
jgi:hypothetical protein